MKKLLSFAVTLFSATVSLAQAPQTTFEKDGTKIIRGFIAKADLITDSSFQWFTTAYKSTTPNATALQNFQQGKDSVHILAFGGTWCSDTKAILPKVYALADAAGFSGERFTLLGVDRQKKAVEHLSEAFGITFVPTFIVLKNGKEVGRVVEWGKTGQPEKEVAALVSGAVQNK